METTTITKLRVNREAVLRHFPEGLTMAEVGVYRGAYSKHLITANPQALYLIDIWKHISDGGVYAELDGCNDSDKRHIRNMQKVQKMFEGDENVFVIQGDGVQVAQTFKPGDLDCVYIDGDHTYDGCLRDLRAYAPLVSERGFIFGHDYTDCYAWIQVPQALETFLSENPGWKLEYITKEKPEKSPSWFLTRETSVINDILKQLI
jgi:hypothetical protein